MDTVRSNNTMKKFARFILDGVNHLLWPAVCTNCGKGTCESDGELCKDCWGKLLAFTTADYCPQCGRDVSKYAILDGACPDCQGKDIHFDKIARGGSYGGSLQEIILAFKKGRTELNDVLGLLIDSALQGSSFYGRIDLFIPVPLHWSRRLARGYNQSLLLAKKLKHPSAQTCTDLVRIRRTRPQPSLTTASGRAANVADAFAVRRGHGFKDRRICLVDDVKTTGATLNECAKTLKQAGAAEVFALVAAVAGQNS